MIVKSVIVVLLVLFVCQERAFGKPRLQRPAGRPAPGIQRVRREIEKCRASSSPFWNSESSSWIRRMQSKFVPPPGIQRVRREIRECRAWSYTSSWNSESSSWNRECRARVRREIENAEQVIPPPGIQRVRREICLLLLEFREFVVD